MRGRTRIYLSLVLGTLTTVGVAWVCAMLPGTSPMQGTSLDVNEHGAERIWTLLIREQRETGRRLFRLDALYSREYEDSRITPELRADIEDAMESFPERRGESSEASRLQIVVGGGVVPHWPHWVPNVPRTDSGLAVYAARACGWPFLAMRSTGYSTDPVVPVKWSSSWRILTQEHYEHNIGMQLGTVPLAPIPLTFGADTLIFAAAWWLLLLGPGDVRRLNRRRCGLCEYCAYSLRGISEAAPCPECGRLRRGSDALLAHQGQHKDDDEEKAKAAAGVVAPAPP